MTAADDARLERAVAILSSDPGYRVLRRLDLDATLSAAGMAVPGVSAGPVATGVAIDVETTGLDTATDRIIELAARRFRYDADGRVLALGRMRVWREDPGVPIPPVITEITGIDQAMVAGREIDAEEATAVIRSSTIIVSHNAAFDRPFVERRLPRAAGGEWGCSLADVDWRSLGREGRALGWLVAQCGWFYDAHRAAGDVDALIALLASLAPDGRTGLAHVLDGMARSGWKVSAEGAGFEARHALRSRGYRWDPVRREWWREVPDARLAEERAWLAGEVYAPGAGARRGGPRVDMIHSGNRYALPS